MHFMHTGYLFSVFCFAVVNATGYIGGSVTMTCKCTGKESKFFCRGQNPTVCLRQGIKAASHITALQGFALKEQAISDSFTVTITDLKSEDAGIYWCGEKDQEYYFTSAVLLSVHNSGEFKVLICFTGILKCVHVILQFSCYTVMTPLHSVPCPDPYILYMNMLVTNCP